MTQLLQTTAVYGYAYRKSSVTLLKGPVANFCKLLFKYYLNNYFNCRGCCSDSSSKFRLNRAILTLT